jgi:transposase
MIVIGTDPHKRSHTASAVDSASGELRRSETVAARFEGQLALLDWARSLDSERIWAIEDCRHVSGGLERSLVASGERVVRVPPKLMAGARRGLRERGKSDPIDALAVARAALREGVECLPCAQLDADALEIRLLLDHREDLVAERTRTQNRLRWHLHDELPELEIPAGALDRLKWLELIARKLRRRRRGARVRIMREQLRRLRELARECRRLERELGSLVRAYAPELLELEGCGVLTAAKLVGETAGVERFETDAKFARTAAAAPIPASSGRSDRHRLDRGGNRQLNLALHRIAIGQARLHEPAQAYLTRKQVEGKSRKEALRCLKRHPARTVFRILVVVDRRRKTSTTPNAPIPALVLT